MSLHHRRRLVPRLSLRQQSPRARRTRRAGWRATLLLAASGVVLCWLTIALAAPADAVTLQPDGKIVTAGYVKIGANLGFAAVRYPGNPKPNETANFDADRRTDISIWNPASGDWTTQRSVDNSLTVRNWGSGALGDRAVPGDYDGDGRADIAVFRASDKNWYIIESGTGAVRQANVGQSGVPVPAAYLPQ